MKQKILLTVALIAVILASVYHVVNYLNSSNDLSTHEENSPASQLQVAAAKPATLDEYVDQLADTYRLKPDKRLINAVSNVHAFLTNTSKDHVESKYVNGYWRIYYKDTLVGQLPEYADFPDFLSLLVSWTNSIVAKNAIQLTGDQLSVEDKEFIENQLALFYAPHAATAAQRLNDLWKEGSRQKEVLPYAVRAMTLLTLQQLDYMEGAEQLSSHAVALLALTKALTSHDMKREEALLSYILGYSAHARSVASDLEPDDVVNAYVHHKNDIVRSIAINNTNNTEAHYLYGLRLAQQDKYKEWYEWFNNITFTVDNMLPVLKTALELDKFSMNERIASILPYTVVVSLAYETGAVNVISFMKLLNRVIFEEYADITELYVKARALAKASYLVTYLETGTSLLKQHYSGPFLDSDTYGSFFRGHFYSGLYRLGMHYLDSLSSEKAAALFTEYLGDPEHPIASDFRKWYQNLSDSKKGKGNPGNLVSDLSEIQRFGAAPLLRTLEEQISYFAFADPGIIRGVRAVVSHLDTRPEHARELYSLAWDSLMDLPLYEKLAAWSINADPADSQYLRPWLAYFRDDSNGLRALLKIDDLKLSVKLKVFNYLEKMGQISSQDLEQEYQKAIENDPDEWRLADSYIDLLMDAKKFENARKVAKNWLVRNEEHPSLVPISMKTLIARTYLEENHLDKAWNIIREVVSSYKGDAMHAAVDILEAKGDYKKAEEIAHAVHNRYPDSMISCVRLAQHYWKRDMYQKAAETLKSSRVRMNNADWQFKVGKKFVEVFTDKPDQRMLAAYEELLKQGIHHERLFSLATVVADSGRFIVATKMIEPLQYPGIGQILLKVRSYMYLKEARGDKEALAWLSEKIPKEMRNPLSWIAFDEKQYDLMWSMIDNPADGSYPADVWASRACAYLKQGKKKDEYYRELIKYYENNKDESRFFTIGRYLLGMADDSEVLTLMMTDKKYECEVAYYIGLRYQTDGDYESASNWYRISMETGLNNNFEYRWAFRQLRKWRNKDRSLSIQAAQERGGQTL